MSELNFEALKNQFDNEIVSLRGALDFDEKDLSKKELQRAVNRLRSVLIATLEHPFYATQEMSQELEEGLFQKTMGLRLLHTAMEMHAISEQELGELEKQMIKEAEEANNSDVESQGEE